MEIKTKLKQLIMTLLDNIHEQRKLILALSCVVVFVTTYVLILPAFTLDKEEASEQGGIDVPGIEQSDDADETVEKPVVKKSAKSAGKETAKANTKEKSADITLENDESDDFSVAVEGKEAVLSDDMSVAVREIDQSDKKQKKEYESLYNDALEAVQKAQEEEGLEKSSDFAFAKFYDISLLDGDTEVKPESAVDVKISFSEELQKELKVTDSKKVHIVHFAVDKETGEVTPEVLDTESTDITIENKKITEATFTTESFSVFAVVYTVDFHWEVDGKEYVFSIPGGGYVTLEQLVEVLGIGNDKTSADETAETEGDTPAETKLTLADVKISDRTHAFAKEVEKVEFSDPELAWVGKVDEDLTINDLKEANKLECQYSDNLTEEQIDEINAQTVKAGDWALISLKPFTSNETLTITMKNGDQFVVRVTDAPDPSMFIGKEVIIYDNGEKRAMLSSGYTYDNRYRLNSIPLSDAEANNAAHWTVERGDDNNYYLKSSDNRYLSLGSNDVGLVNRQSVATPLSIQAGGNPDYRISAAGNSNNVLSYSTNNNWGDGYFSAPGGKNGSPNQEWLYISVVETVPDRTGDWMLYFDDDFDEITVHVGETITLRPYDKWVWSDGRTVNVQDGYSTAYYLVQDQKYWNAGNWDNWAMSKTGNDITNGESTVEKSTDSDGIFEFTRYIKKDNQLRTFYWSVQGIAKKTGDYVLTNTEGKTITVHVVDGDPVNKPKTVSNVANIKVNLFDYDKTGMLDGSWNEGNQWWNDDNHANQPNNYKNDSINKESGSSHFYFLSSGGGDNNNESWNNYTHRNANTGIVKNELDSNGYPVLNRNGSNARSLQYLFDTSTESQSWHGGNNNDAMIAYPDVVGMFQKDNDGFYYYNSNTNYFYYDTENGTSKLYEHTYTQTSGEEKGSLANDKPIGFFPFHDYDATNNVTVNQNHNLNHHLGMSMDIEFMLPKNKYLDEEKTKPIVFDFSGDDDLWVFVEWEDDNGQKQTKLLLDLGGVHQPIYGNINFSEGTSTSGIDVSFIKPNQPYTLKVFYLERGGCDSNCSIRFNLPIIQDLVIAKKLTGLTEAEKNKYKDEEFTYEVIVNDQLYNYPNPDNKYEKAVIRDADGNNVTPDGFTIVNGQVKLKDGYTLTISYLDRSDTFRVAEENTPNMENFERPNAERYYHQPQDASLYEQEITLEDSQTQGTSPSIKEWITPNPPYDLEDTEKVTFTNTLKEKNLEVEKKWKGNKAHPDSITFTVSASVDDGHGGRTPYAVSELKNSDGTDKVFTLNDENKWRYEIEHLPVNTPGTSDNPEGKFIFYDINEGHVEGYTLTGLRDVTAETYNYCNVDVVKLWPDSNSNHTEVLQVVLKNPAEKYYAGVDEDGEAIFVDDIHSAEIRELTPDNNYLQRYGRLPYEEEDYEAVQLHEDEYNHGLATYKRAIIQYELENSPTEGPVDPEDEPNAPEIHKRIDALRDGVANPDSPHANEDLTDLYRLYLDYKVKSLQEANGVDLLFVIDHSGSMNNYDWQGNPYRASAVEAALNGDDGLISEFLEMNENNQWAAVGFKGPDGATNYYWGLGNPWYPATSASAYNAGQNGSEVLSSGGENYVFTRNDATSPQKNVALANEGANILTNYTAGLWRAEQFLLKQGVKDDGRKKVIVFISDGIPTLHIECPNETLEGAGTAAGSPYYRDAYGGCPTQTLTEFGYFVNDMTKNGYKFGENMEFYTIGFGGTMQTESGSQLLNGMLNLAYPDGHTNHFMTISDATSSDYSAATEKLKNDLRTIMGMNEKFTNLVIQDDLSTYVDLYGLAGAGEDAAGIMRAAKAKVTMEVPDPDNPDEPQIVTLYENGAPVDSDAAKFIKADGTTKANIIQRLEYDAATKTVKAIFDPEYQASAGVVYTLSFDVKTTERAYTNYAANGYDTYTSGDKLGQVITGDEDTDFLGTDPANATSVDKAGFRSNDEAKATYKHNNKDEESEYPHPVIQVAAKADIVKTDQTGAALEGAKFNLYDHRYDESKTIEENAAYLIEANLQSKKPTDPAGEDAVIRNGKLTVGTYYLVETEAPGGFNSLPGPIKITVTETTTGILNMSAEIAGEYVGDNKLVKSGYGVWKLIIQNSEGYELPHTGGSGTIKFYLLGITLIGLAGTGCLVKRRRRNAA